MKANIKNIFLAVAIGGFITVTATSCKKDDPAPATNTITDKVVADAAFSVLEKAAIKAGLTGTLSSAGPFTVFAPDDAAFAAAGITSATIDTKSADELKKLLLYHTLTAKILAADVPAGPNAKVETAAVPPVAADSIFVTRNASGVYVNGIKVKTANVGVDNGVIHVLDKALTPASGNIVATAQSVTGGDNGLDSLVVAVLRVNGAGTPVVDLLSNQIFTVFAPTNKAFREVLGALGVTSIAQVDIATLTGALTYHVRRGRAFSSDLSNAPLTMFAGGNTTINLTNGTSGGPTITGTGNGTNKSNIIATNVLCRNGVVHLIDRVLLP